LDHGFSVGSAGNCEVATWWRNQEKVAAMHRDELVTQVRARARLHGRKEAGRVIRAVLLAFRPLVPDVTFQRFARQLPDEVRAPLAEQGPWAEREPSVENGTARAFVRQVARRLHIDEPNAAFLSRVVFEQLNDYCREVTPASVAASLPAELRPLISARAETGPPSRRHLAALSSNAELLQRRTRKATDDRLGETMPGPSLPAVIPELVQSPRPDAQRAAAGGT
jgi:uncharacterized protein (DUF2267 family)